MNNKRGDTQLTQTDKSFSIQCLREIERLKSEVGGFYHSLSISFCIH